MSFIGDLFGGGSSNTPQLMTAPTPPPVAPVATPVQAAPTLSDAASVSAAQEATTRLNKRYGQGDTMLTPGGLGDRSSGGDSDISRTSALGGGASPS